jgi:hypothetical protein
MLGLRVPTCISGRGGSFQSTGKRFAETGVSPQGVRSELKNRACLCNFCTSDTDEYASRRTARHAPFDGPRRTAGGRRGVVEAGTAGGVQRSELGPGEMLEQLIE